MEPMTAFAVAVCGYLAFKGVQKVRHFHTLGKRAQLRKEMAAESLTNLQSAQFKIKPGVVLKTNEQPVFSSACTMTRNVRNGSTSVGGNVGVRVNIAKGLSLSSSSGSRKSVANYSFESEDGEIIITNQRVIFSGASIDFAVQHKELANVVVSNNTVLFDILKSSGADFTVIFHNDQLTKLFSKSFVF